jgi:hypothetical protein
MLNALGYALKQRFTTSVVRTTTLKAINQSINFRSSFKILQLKTRVKLTAAIFAL